MPDYLIRPRSPLMFRIGQPFGSTDAGRTLPFPTPATIAGAVRGAFGEQFPNYSVGQQFRDRKGLLRHNASLRSHSVAGPLLAVTALDRSRIEIWAPRPRDAEHGHTRSVESFHVLMPHEGSCGSGGNWPDGLLPLVPGEKPVKGWRRLGTDGLWHLSTVIDWLCAPQAVKQIGVTQKMMNPLPVETRSHAPQDWRTGSVIQGALFQTQAIDFGPPVYADARQSPIETDHDYALVVQSSLAMESAWRTLGGRSALVRVERQDGLWPQDCPARLVQALRRTNRLRLMLLTPAVFKTGYRPGWLSWDNTIEAFRGTPPGFESDQLDLKLCAVATGPWLPSGGWDMRNKRVRALRRAVSAGSVYWFEVMGEPLSVPVIQKLWMHCISDGKQDQCDGFGLAVPGVWDSPQ